MPKRVGEVSVDQLESGVRLALQSARRLALAAAAAEDAHTAAVLLYQSAEEVGKAKLLHDQFVAGKPLSGARLRDHVEKFRVAVDVIPPDCLELWGPAFDPAVFQADAFQTEPIRVDWERRQASLYANWDEDRKVWSEPATPDARVVRTSAARLVDFIDHAIGNGLR